jgi:23S rRNA pseudouridine2605 synthase
VIQRLQRYLASAGLGSRRACEELITAGRVTVDGVVATLGSTVDPEVQEVALDGGVVRPEIHEYWVLNKPRGVVATASDPQGRRTVVDCVPSRARVFPVGRLDLETTGVLVLTNDGELTNRLIHPRYGVEKEYQVVVAGRVSPAAVRALERGVELEDGPTAPTRIRVARQSAETTELVMVLHEGRKRQVRRMLDMVGHPVLQLHRSRFDGLSDDGLAVGEVRHLLPTEIATLRTAGGLS